MSAKVTMYSRMWSESGSGMNPSLRLSAGGSAGACSNRELSSQWEAFLKIKHVTIHSLVPGF
jgi:hypothetical protein